MIAGADGRVRLALVEWLIDDSWTLPVTARPQERLAGKDDTGEAKERWLWTIGGFRAANLDGGMLAITGIMPLKALGEVGRTEVHLIGDDVGEALLEMGGEWHGEDVCCRGSK